MVLVLSENDVKKSINMKQAINTVELSFDLLGKNKVKMTQRSELNYPDTPATVRTFTSSIDVIGALGTKMVLGKPQSRKKDLTYFLGILYDSQDSHVVAIMAANRLTQLRTGAASAVATKYLCTKQNVKVGLFGSGVQARGQIEGLNEILEIDEIKIYDIMDDKRDQLIKELKSEYGLNARAAESPDDTVKNSDIVVTATTSNLALFPSRIIDDGTHINAIGSNNPSRREIGVDTLKRAKVVVDSRDTVLNEAGDILIPIKMGQIGPNIIYAELSEIVTGQKQGRINDEEITLFESVGIPSEDVAMMKAIYLEAEKKGYGTEIEI